EKDVVDGIELGVPADAELEDRRDAGVDSHLAAVGGVDAAQHFEQRALARPVAPHDAERISSMEGEGHVLQHRQAIDLPWSEQAEEMFAHRVATNARDREC